MRRAVLVTRPEPGLAETCAAVEQQGWQAVACPVLDIRPVSPMGAQAEGVIAITSAQALPFLAHQSRDHLLLTVGSSTARRAREMGFTFVEAAGGSQAELEALCRQKNIGGERLLFACGRGRHGQAYGADIADRLGAKRVDAYFVQAQPHLSTEACAALEHGEVEAVLFYSSETVAVFMEQCPANLRSKLKEIRALCLSGAIARRVYQYNVCGSVSVGKPLDLLGDAA